MNNEDKKAYKSNISKYLFFRVFSNIMFFPPIIVLFFQDNGLNLTQILLLQSFYSVIAILLEVPTGAVADKFSRRLSLLIGSGMLTLAAFVYSGGTSFVHFLIAEMFWAISLAFISGADTALLYDSLKALKKEKTFKQVQGRALYYYLVTGGISAVVGGLVGKYSLRLPWLLTALFSIGLFIIALRFKEPKHTMKVEKPRYWDLIIESCKFVRKHKLIRWYILFFSITGLVTMIGFWASQPYMKSAGLDVAYFGVVYFLFNIVAAVSSKYAHKVENFLGIKGMLYLIAFLAVAPLFFLGGYVFKLGFLLLTIFQIVRGFSTPVFENVLLKYTYADKRATVLSLKGLIYRVIYAGIMPIFGVLTDTYSLNVAFAISGGFFTAGLIIFLFLYAVIPKKYFKIKKKVKEKQ